MFCSLKQCRKNSKNIIPMRAKQLKSSSIAKALLVIALIFICT